MLSCRETHMLRTSLALAVVLMLWTPFDAHATCKQVKAESDILGRPRPGIREQYRHKADIR